MRDLKFRAWDGKQMIPWVEMCMRGLNQFWYKDSPQILQQFTGLKDKNGKEIYEGDIVRRMGGNLEVYWHKNTACWRMTGQTGIVGSDMALMCEVIDNIYEHPELIKKARERSEWTLMRLQIPFQ